MLAASEGAREMLELTGEPDTLSHSPLMRPRPQITVRAVERRDRGWIAWLSTTDHKRIGILYLYTCLVFFVLGGVEAMLMRTQLAVPENTFLTPEKYNQVMTLHGSTMIFLVIVPVWAGFANYLLPLMIGARDVAFPRSPASPAGSGRDG